MSHLHTLVLVLLHGADTHVLGVDALRQAALQHRVLPTRRVELHRRAARSRRCAAEAREQAASLCSGGTKQATASC